MLINNVTIPHEEFVDGPVGAADHTVYRIETAIGENAVARMHISRMRYPVRLRWYTKFRWRSKDCWCIDYRVF